MKFSKLTLTENLNFKACRTIKEKRQINNAASFYQIASLFNLLGLCKATYNYLERCFTSVVTTENFLESDYTSISKILASSGLLITSEIEVFDSVHIWLNYNIDRRSKHAKNLLPKVRFNLLSDDTIELSLNKSTLFTKTGKLITINKQVLDCNENFKLHKSITNPTSRYCNQKMFNILICGGLDTNL